MTLNQLIISLTTLRAHDAAIHAATQRAVADQHFDGDPDVETAFRYYTVFSQELEVLAGLGELTPKVNFYNAYYWFKRFVAAHRTKRGYDAGLEQQAFQMLEEAPEGLDWSVLEQIDRFSERSEE